MLLLGHGFP